MVHHIRAEEDKFISTKNTNTNNKEHMFALITGNTSKEVGQLLLDPMSRWRDITTDHLETSSGMTPRLLTAAVIEQHGYSVWYQDIKSLYNKLDERDKKLTTAIEKLQKETKVSTKKATAEIQRLSKNLIEMIEINRNLASTRSTMHYLAESANVLVNKINTFEDYVKARLGDWGENPPEGRQEALEKLELNFHQLDSYKQKIRDNDRLTMVCKHMLQHKTDIKSLQQRIDINVGMVSYS
jgi:hypothetical protein